MKFEEFTTKRMRPNMVGDDTVSLTTGGWYFGIYDPGFKFAKILFDQESGTVKFVPTETREHLGVGYVSTYRVIAGTTYTLKNVKFVESGIAPMGRYRKVKGQELTYKFYQPARKPAVKRARTYTRTERRKINVEAN